MNRLTAVEQEALMNMPPRVREDLIRESIRDAYRGLSSASRVTIDSAVDHITLFCAGQNLGKAAGTEILAKLGMYLNRREE